MDTTYRIFYKEMIKMAFIICAKCNGKTPDVLRHCVFCGAVDVNHRIDVRRKGKVVCRGCGESHYAEYSICPWCRYGGVREIAHKHNPIYRYGW